jgi:ABC-2 type transport system permease protein
MRRIWAITSKELQTYFYSPTSYIAFAFYMLVSSILFYVDFVLTQPSIVDVRYVVGSTTFIYLFIIPLLTMRLVADEFRQGTDELLLTSPASIGEIVIGKFLSGLIVQLLLVVSSLVYPLIMSAFGTLDQPVLWLSYIGMFLMGAAMMAIGLFASSLTNNQMVAGVASFALLLMFWLVDMIGSAFGSKAQEIISHFSLNGRLQNLEKGVLNGADLIFYLSLALVFIVLSMQVLERKRWR